MEALEASHDMARLELSYTEIRSPIKGVVSERFIKIGNTIDVNTPAFKVTSLEPLVSYMHVPEKDTGDWLPARQPASAWMPCPSSASRASLPGSAPSLIRRPGTFKLTIEVSDESRRLKPGMFGRISIVSDMHAQALQIPRNAIVEDGVAANVFVVTDDVVEKRIVQTGYAADGQVEILSGLDDGEVIVVVGQAG